MYKEIIDRLIKIGNVRKPDNQLFIDNLKQIMLEISIHDFLSTPWPRHDTYIVSLSADELIDLLKSMVILENFIYADGNTSSCSASIFIFQLLREKDYELSLIALDWIIKYSNSRYLPFGSWLRNPFLTFRKRKDRTLDTYIEVLAKKREIRRKKAKDHETLMEQQQVVSQKFKKHKKEKSHLKKDSADKHRIEILNKMNEMSYTEKMIFIAQGKYSVDFYPVSLSYIPQNELKVLDDNTLDLLLDKLQKTDISEWITLKNLIVNEIRIRSSM